MLKKILIFILLISILLIPFSDINCENEKIIIRLRKGDKIIYINDKPLVMDVAPIEIPPGRIMVPVRFVSEGLGAKVDWIATTETVYITLDNIEYLKNQINSLNKIITSKEEEIHELNNEIDKYKRKDDYQAPEIEIFNPKNIEVFETEDIYIRGKITDDNIVKFSFVYNFSNFSYSYENNLNLDKDGNFEYKIKLREGYNYIFIIAIDGSGNISYYYLNLIYESSIFGIVKEVISGDKIKLQSGKIIKYLGVDSPDEGEYLFDEAKEFNRELVEGKEIKLVYDSYYKEDKYGNNLAYVYLKDTYKFVNVEIIERGFAFIDNSYNFASKYNDLERAQDNAKDYNKGLWLINIKIDYIFSVGDIKHEGIKIINRGRTKVDMSKFIIKTEKGYGYIFPENFTLEPGKSVSLYTGQGDNTNDALYWNSKTSVIDQKKDTLFLYDLKLNLIDIYSF